MPTAAPKPCTVCAVLVTDGTTRCAGHKVKQWVARPEVQRTRGRILQRQRAALFMREPLCRMCSQQGRVSQASIRDHIVPLAEGGSDDDSNIQPLCRSCSDIKTAQESAKGRGVQVSGLYQPETDLEVKFSCAVVSGGGVLLAGGNGGLR
jgi:5-methylcytosine-specific restriction protein A